MLPVLLLLMMMIKLLLPLPLQLLLSQLLLLPELLHLVLLQLLLQARLLQLPLVLLAKAAELVIELRRRLRPLAAAVPLSWLRRLSWELREVIVRRRRRRAWVHRVVVHEVDSVLVLRVEVGSVA